MKTILLTGARAPVTLDLARALSQAGHRVIAAESLSHALSHRSNAFHAFHRIPAPNTSFEGFIDALVRIIRTEKVDLLIPTCEEIFHVSRGLATLKNECEVLADDFEKIARLHSKVEFNHWVRHLGFQAPLTERSTGIESMKQGIRQMPGESVVLKPEYSRFASKTLVISKSEAFTRADQLEQTAPWAVQECLKGQEYCTYSVAKNGVLLSHVTYDHEFTAGRGAGICFQSIRHEWIEAWVREFVKKTNFTGQIAFDFIDDGQGQVRPLECNPRATSGLHLIAHEPHFIRALLDPNPRENEIARPTPSAMGQLRLAMLVYGLPSIRSMKSALSWCRTFLSAREVIFSVNDPRPFFDQFISFYQLIRDSKRLGITPLEVSTRDIEWNGP
jgi:predicted ATP-grasp superfamily ATP-dependent carboligase